MAMEIGRKPDYEREGVRLYLGDCLEILPGLEAGSVDAVVTDPPYHNMAGGISFNHDGVAKRNAPTLTVGSEFGDASGLALCRRIASLGAIAFCSFHWIDECVALLGGERRALITWYKRNSPYSVNNAPWYTTEFIWAVQYAPGINWRELHTHFDIPMLAAGCMAGERIVKDGKSVHRCQKPVALMQSIMVGGMDTILDPFMGIGTTGVACIRTGRRFIGIERDPPYFAVAVERIEREFDRTPLLDAAEKERQKGLF